MPVNEQFLSLGLLILSGLVNLTIGIFIYLFAYKLSSGRYTSSKYFAFIGYSIFSWALWLGLRTVYFYPSNNVLGMYLTNIGVFISMITIIQTLVFFALSFHATQRSLQQYRFLYGPYLLVLIAIIVPNVGMLQLNADNPIAYTSPAYYIFLVYMSVYSGLYMLLLYNRYRLMSSPIAQKHIRLIAIGTIFSILVMFITNISFPVLFQDLRFVYYGPVSFVFLSLIVVFAMIRYQLFRIPLSIVGLLTTLIITILLLIIRVVIVDQNFTEGVTSSLVTMIMFIALYSFLMREVYYGAKKQMILDKKKSELEIALDSKNDFLKNASHQLRTPLTVIQGYLSMITSQSDAKYELNQNALNDLQKTYTSAKNLNAIINDVLAANDVNAGRFGINIKDTVNLKLFIQDILDAKHEFFMNKSTKVVFKVKGSDFHAFIDKYKFKEALNNILDNSVFYGKGKVIVTLDASHKSIFKIDIKDNGVGITSVESKKIWKKFERGKKSALINPNGSGLGLYLAKQIMTKHGGDITAHSEGRDQGSTFSLLLPKDTLTSAPPDSFGINITPQETI